MIPVQYRISTSQHISLDAQIQAALKAGCKWIQLKTNGETGKSWIENLIRIKELCREQEATLIIEDHVELVKAIDGDGIHITDNTPVATIRQQLGEGFLIGANVQSAEDIIAKKQQSADYLCIGPCLHPLSDDYADAFSLEDLNKIMTDIEEKEIYLPICAFGKIQLSEVASILETGIRGISISKDSYDLEEMTIEETLSQFLNL